MPARLTTKCPECNNVTGDCIDHGATVDRVEFDGKRCHDCCVKARIPRRLGKDLPGARPQFIRNKKTAARVYSIYAGSFGIR